MPTFTPPITGTLRRTDADPVLVKKNPLGNRLMANFVGNSVSANVYVMLDGTVIGYEPSDYSLVAYTYQGAHVHTISAAEAATLTAAGYGSSIT